MENPVNSLFNMVVSFAFLATTLVTDSLGNSSRRARNRARRSRRALARATHRSARVARLAAGGLRDAAQGIDDSWRAVTNAVPVGRK